jgi:hypothetical protein
VTFLIGPLETLKCFVKFSEPYVYPRQAHMDLGLESPALKRLAYFRVSLRDSSVIHSLRCPARLTMIGAGGRTSADREVFTSK